MEPFLHSAKRTIELPSLSPDRKLGDLSLRQAENVILPAHAGARRPKDKGVAVGSALVHFSQHLAVRSGFAGSSFTEKDSMAVAVIFGVSHDVVSKGVISELGNYNKVTAFAASFVTSALNVT